MPDQNVTLYPRFKSDQQKALIVFVCAWCLCIHIFHGTDRKWPSALPTSRHERQPLTRTKMIPQITVRKEKGIWSWREINEPVNWKNFSHLNSVFLGANRDTENYRVTQSRYVLLREKRWLVGPCQVPLLLAFDRMKLWLIVWYFGSFFRFLT